MSSTFPDDLKMAKVTPALKEEIKMTLAIVGPFLSFLQLLEFLKSLYMTKCMLILSILIFYLMGSLALDHSIL